MTKLGRLSDAEKELDVLHDAPQKQMAAVMSKLDEIIKILKDLTAKLDADSGVNDTNYASTLTDALKEIELKL
jgi:hypothetical protein